MATIGRGAAVRPDARRQDDDRQRRRRCVGAVHLALLPTNEDRAKAVVDWVGAGGHAPAGRPDHRRGRVQVPRWRRPLLRP